MSIKKYNIPNLQKACELLQLLHDSGHAMEFRSIQKQTAIPRTTLIRILDTLEHQRFVKQSSPKEYTLGTEFLRIGSRHFAGHDVRLRAGPYLKRLSEQTRGTAHLAVLSGQHSLIVAVQESPERIRAASKVGFLADLHCSSTGKCFLAFAVSESLEMWKQLEKDLKTPNTIIRLDQFLREMERIRRSGVAIDNEEYSLGVRCCAAPVYDNSGTVVAAIGITAPATIFPVSEDERIAAITRDAANELSRTIGYDSSNPSALFTKTY